MVNLLSEVIIKSFQAYTPCLYEFQILYFSQFNFNIEGKLVANLIALSCLVCHWGNGRKIHDVATPYIINIWASKWP